MNARADIDAALQNAADAGSVPGIVAMATDGKETIYEGAFGERTLGGGSAMQLDTVFWIASMTKAITATCCMQLVEQGRLSLDDDLGSLLPALAHPKVLEGFDAAGQPILRPAKTPITLRRLLTHTAGFAYDMWNADMLAYSKANPIPRHETFIQPQDCLPLAFDPGQRWAYGVNIDWAGKALEAVTGQSLDAYMQANVCKPLGMDSTGYRVRPEISARLAGMHQRQPDGKLVPTEYDPPSDPATFLGGGGLYGSCGDYLRFVRMILNQGSLDGVQVLKPETVALMGQNHMADLDVEVMNTAIPSLSNTADFWPGTAKKWGLSFLINTHDVPGGRAAGSLCWGGLRNTYFWIDPARQVGGVIMTQILPWADPTVLGLYDDLERGVYRMNG